MKTLVCVVVAWLVFAALFAAQCWPDLPRSALGWIALVVFGTPMFVLVEGAIESLSEARRRRRR